MLIFYSDIYFDGVVGGDGAPARTVVVEIAGPGGAVILGRPIIRRPQHDENIL